MDICVVIDSIHQSAYQRESMKYLVLRLVHEGMLCGVV